MLERLTRHLRFLFHCNHILSALLATSSHQWNFCSLPACCGTKSRQRTGKKCCDRFQNKTFFFRYGLEAVDRKLRSIRGLDLPFGGMVFVTGIEYEIVRRPAQHLGGDWKQVHPILPGAPTSEAIALSVKRSPIWGFFEVKQLKFNMRARDDPHWAEYLLCVGNGIDFAGTEGEIFLPDEILSAGDLIDDVYRDLFTRQMSFEMLTEYLVERAIIAPLNQTCEDYNREIVSRLPGETMEHISVDEIVADTVEEGEYYSTEFLNTLDPAELPPSRLRLKQGVVCMLLRNLRVEDGKLCA